MRKVKAAEGEHSLLALEGIMILGKGHWQTFRRERAELSVRPAAFNVSAWRPGAHCQPDLSSGAV